MKIAILLADDHQLLREGVKMLLRSERDLKLIGEAVDGQSAVSLAHDLKPDVVIMDVSLPKIDGIEATRQIKARDPQIKVLGFSANLDQQLENDLLEAGASGFVPKEMAFEYLAIAIRTVMKNETFVSHQIC